MRHLIHVAALLIGFSSSHAWAGADDIRFAADLSADEESSPTYSDAVGHAEVILDRETLKITWKVTYKGLSGPPVTAGLFGPENAGANAGIVIDLGTKGLNSPLEGSLQLNDGQFQYLITGRLYVNILTSKWKTGEIRGQLRRQRKGPDPVPPA